MKTEIEIRHDVTVELVQCMGSDAMIASAARVSTKGELAASDDELRSTDAEVRDKAYTKNTGLINYLMKNRHGTPFEHGALTFFIHAPIFVSREMFRHRVGWSYNEESGRYRELQPVFYIPASDRPGIIQKEGGRPGHYEYEDANDHQHGAVVKMHKSSFELSYLNYKALLLTGISKEVARGCLPVALYSSWYATCNPRSLMHFLSLRTKAEHAKFPSSPQREIEMVADEMEWLFSREFPQTFKAYDDNGRVAP